MRGHGDDRSGGFVAIANAAFSQVKNSPGIYTVSAGICGGRPVSTCVTTRENASIYEQGQVSTRYLRVSADMRRFPFFCFLKFWFWKQRVSDVNFSNILYNRISNM